MDRKEGRKQGRSHKRGFAAGIQVLGENTGTGYTNPNLQSKKKRKRRGKKSKGGNQEKSKLRK